MDLPPLPHPFNRRDAEAAGLSRRALEEAVRLGWVRRIRRGWYAVVAREPERPGDEQWQRLRQEHLDGVREQLRRFPGHVASHTSAALIQGLGVMISRNSPVELTAFDGCQRSQREDGLVIHHCDSTDTPVEVIDGLRVTTTGRTVADTMRTRTLPHGTALADEVLRDGRLTEAELRTVLDGEKRWRGRPRALVALELSDRRRQTWLEGYSDVRLYQCGVPLPLPQVWIFDEDGRPVALVDGLDAALGVVREADGHGKYFLDMARGASPEESVRARLAAERARQARLERLGLRLVRWTYPQVRDDAEQIADRWKALRAAPVPPVRGYAEWEGQLRRLPFSVPAREVDLEKARTRRHRRGEARRRAA